MAAEGTREAVALDEQSLKQVRRCRICMGQGLNGFAELKAVVRKAREAAWISQIPLNDAVKSNCLPSLRFLLEEAKVETLNVNLDGYTPLQLAVIWGKPHIMVYLLSLGADPMLEGDSVVEMARVRQQRLQRAFDEAGDGVEFEGVSITKNKIEPLIREGHNMVEVLEGVEAEGSFSVWAGKNSTNPLVRRFAVQVENAEPRYKLAVCRALVLAEKATLRSAAERDEVFAEEVAEAAARAKEECPLKDALIADGFSASTAKEIQDAFRQVTTVKSLKDAALSTEEIDKGLDVYVRNGRVTEGDRRKFIRFVREVEQPTAPALTQASPAKSTAAGKAKAKSAAPAAKAALLAMASKGAKAAGRGYASAKAAPAKGSGSKAAAIDGMPLLFNVDLPSSAFMLITCFLHGI